MSEVACPKAMTYGPCGGVRPDGACEVPGHRCPFDEAVPWDGAIAAPRRPSALRVLLDIRPGRGDDRRTAAAVNGLADVVDAVLIGEHLDDDPPLPPRHRARWAAEHLDVPTFVTLTGRGRDVDAVRAEVEAIAALGSDMGVHAVTGDHPAARPGLGHEPPSPEQFGVDCFTVIAAASAVGLPVSAAASPGVRPVAARGGRAVDKVRAGAGTLIANHVDDTGALASFADAVRGAADVDVVAPVALLADADSVRRLAGFPGCVVPRDDVAAVLEAPPEQTRQRGIEVAIERSRIALRCPGVTGINLSGTGPTDPDDRADFVRSIVEQLSFPVPPTPEGIR